MKPLLLLLSLLAAPSLAQNAKPLPDHATVRKILAERIDAKRQGVGIVVGLVDASGRRIVSHGTFDNDGRPVGGDTLFEIGSVTKVFTSLLLADAAGRGELSLDDPVAKHLPEGVKVPERAGKKIRLSDLATHTSGLPYLPANLLPKDVTNPYADYGRERMFEFLSSYELPRDVGAGYEYSNFGAGLLGNALERRLGSDYETLVRERITGPLKMKSTSVAVADPKRLAPGHDPAGARVPNWDLGALTGAGALRSSVSDLLELVAVAAGLEENPLAEPFATMLRDRRPTGTAGLEIALGWHVTSRGGREFVWHNGATGGYASFVAFEPKRRAVVVLSNMALPAVAEELGMSLLDAPSVFAPAKERKKIAVDAKVLERYVGRYELAPGFVLTVTREENRIFLQATGQLRVELFAEAPSKFFLEAVDARLEFEAGDGVQAVAAVLFQNGREMRAKRMTGDAPPPKERKEVALDPALLDRYVGRYQLAPTFQIAITREGDRLYLQATAQPRFELFAEGEDRFFLKVVDAQVTFSEVKDGRAGKLVLHQNGMDVPGPRVE